MGGRRWRASTWRLIMALLVLTTPALPLVHWPSANAGGLAPATTTLAFPPPPILASAAAVLDADTGAWLYESHAGQSFAMASTTKIMTAVLALEHGHLNDLVKISAAAAGIGQTTMGLKKDERVPVHDLLYGLLLPSGNDAGIAIAEHVGGSVAGFVRMMNARAAALHLTQTHYLNPYGFFPTPDGDDPAHHTSARDLVVLARYAMQFPLFRTIVASKHIVIRATSTHHAYDLHSINYVINWYPGADGIKPGWTSGAGICQVVDVHRFGRHLIAAILHTPNLYTDVRDLMDYGLHDFGWIPSGFQGDTVDQSVPGGTAADPTLFFPYTGHSVHGAFLKYFRAHGGLAVFGFPRTEVVSVDGDVEQFFTNQVLSFHPGAGIVTAQRLGLQSVPNEKWLARVAPVPNTDWRTYFPQTGHTVTYRFRRFYLDEGGPATFGYPITEKLTMGSRLVQFFENTEFIWHATGANTGYIAMAPLGQSRLDVLGLLPTGAPIAPPVAPVNKVGPRPTATAIKRSASSRPTATSLPSVTPLPTSTPTWSPLPTSVPTTTPSATGTPTPVPTSPLQHRASPSATFTPRSIATPARPIDATDTPVPANP